MNKLGRLLLEEKKFLLKALELVNNQLLELYSSDLSDISDFPLSSKVSEKVLWLFNNVFTEGQRFTQIQETFNQYNGSERRLDGIIRGLKAKGKLVIVKYNKSNKLSYWGLSEWVDERGFKTEYKPKELSTDIESSEVIK